MISVLEKIEKKFYRKNKKKKKAQKKFKIGLLS